MEKFLEVENPTYKSLFAAFAGNYKFKIPPYQRPYVWNTQKVTQLLEDWKEFLETEGDNSLYFMGAIILHRDEISSTYNIVDGQQRLTTLLTIDYCLNQEESILKRYPNKLDFNFSAHTSMDNIRKNAESVWKTCSEKGRYSNLKGSGIFNRLKFTVIITDNEDDAFTFFDSQNNRGVQPRSVDVMKAVHLRAITNDDDLRKDCANKWENMQSVTDNIFSKAPEDYMHNLVDMALWRIRKWRGREFDNNSNYDSSMTEFANHPKSGKGNVIQFYDITLSKEIKFEHTLNSHQVSASKTLSTTFKAFPFSIRQPLLKGVCSFAYIETYHKIAQKLFCESPCDNEVKNMRELYSKLYSELKMSSYMSDYFILCILAYYDKFGSAKLYHFSLGLDYVLGMIRMNYFYFKDIAMRNFTSEHNILDCIQISFEPEEIINYLISIEFEKRQRNPNAPINDYVAACKEYFGYQINEEDIRDYKREWTNNRINGQI